MGQHPQHHSNILEEDMEKKIITQIIFTTSHELMTSRRN